MNEILEDRRGVGQPIRHHQIFEVSCGGQKCHLPFISSLNSDEIIGTTNVKFCKDASSPELFQGSRDEGKRIDGDVIEGSIVDAQG